MSSTSPQINTDQHRADAAESGIRVISLKALKSLLSTCWTCKRENTDEWMLHFVGKMNDAIQVVSDVERFIYDRRTGEILVKDVDPDDPSAPSAGSAFQPPPDPDLVRRMETGATW